LVGAFFDRLAHPAQWNHAGLERALLYWIAFVLIDLSAGAIGMAMEREAPWASLPWVPVQRFGYRQLMYYVVIKAVVTAVRGPQVGWGKLERTAGVTFPPAGRRAGSVAVIGAAGQDGDGAIDLLGQHDAGQGVRPGLRPEREPVAG